MEEEDGRVKQENNSLDESASGFGAAAVGPVSNTPAAVGSAHQGPAEGEGCLIIR